MIDRSKDVCFSESSDLAVFEVRKGARTVSRDDVSAYFATVEGIQLLFSEVKHKACLYCLPSAMS